jgi:hypothetical protein
MHEITAIYTEWFGDCLNITSNIRIIPMLKSLLKLR